MQSKIVKKIFSVMLSVCLILQMSIGPVYADGSNAQEIPTYTSFEIPEDKKEITVPLETTEAKVIALLPTTINATLKSTTTTGTAVTIDDVVWECKNTKTFSSETQGEVFEFIGAPAGQFHFEGSILLLDALPTIKVTIGPPVPPSDMTLVDGATYGGNITTKGLLLHEKLPATKMQYKAGSGYVLFTPWSQTGTGKAKIELNNATITAETSHAISLPATNIDLLIKGDNEFQVNFGTGNNGIYGENTKLSVTGDGKLTIKEADNSPISGFGIKLVGSSEFIRMGNDTFKLNLISYTEYYNRKEQEVFGTAVLSDDIADNAVIILHEDAQLILQKPAYADVKENFLLNKMSIYTNAKLIIDEGVYLGLAKDIDGNLPKIYNNGGSIVVRGTLDLPDNSYLTDIGSQNITIEDEGRVLIDGKVVDIATGKFKFDEMEEFQLSPDNGGEYSCGNGNIKWEPQMDADGNLTGGTLTMNNVDIEMQEDVRVVIRVYEGRDVPITLNIIGDNTIENSYGDGIYIDDLTITGSGYLTVTSEMPIVYENKFDMTNFSGKLNAIVVKYKYDLSYGRRFYATAYGIFSYLGEEYYNEFTVSEGSQLIIESGATLGTGTFTNNGEVINNGTLCMQVDVDDAGLKVWAYDYLNLKGTGIVIVTQVGGGSIHATFTNDGKLINETYDTPLDFSNATEDQGELAKDGYHWDNETKTLTLENLILRGYPSSDDKMAISLPEEENVTLELKGNNKIIGFKSAVYQGSARLGNGNSLPEAKGSLTITGDGMLTSEDREEFVRHTEDVLTTTGKLIMQSSNLVMASSEGRTIKAVGMEINGGTIGNESINSPICSLGDFLMSGGKVISGTQDSGSIEVFGDMTITGGELITGESYNGILIQGGNLNMMGGNLTIGKSYNGLMIQNGNFTMTGGNLTIHNDEKASIGIGLASLVEQVEKFSVSGGVLDIKVGMAAIIFMNASVTSGDPTFDTNGMTVTTSPIGGTLKSKIIQMPSMPGPEPMPSEIEIYSFTADENLVVELGRDGINIKNACKSMNIVKTPSNPTGDGSSNGGGSTNSDSKPTSDEPTKATAVVDCTVTDKTANITVSKDTVAGAIKKAKEEAKKNGNEENGIEIEIKVDTKGSAVENISASLSKEPIEELVKEGVKELSINSSLGKINLDLETLKAIQKQVGSDVAVSAKRVDNAQLSAEAKAIVGNRPVYDFTIIGSNGEKVTQFGKGKISLSLPYTLGENEKSDNLTVYYIDDKGNLKEMSNVVYDEKTKSISFETDHFSKFAVGYKQANTAAEGVFTDIDTHWAKDDINFVVQRGLFGGTEKDKFSPNMPMTRGMFVTVLGRLANADVSSYSQSHFTDVKAGSYYLPYIEWANKNNIVSGMSSDSFAPDEAITREQMAVLMANYSKMTGFELPQLQSEMSFEDESEISSYAKSSVKQMQMAGIISGRKINQFDAKGTATRAEACAVLKRYIELIEKK